MGDHASGIRGVVNDALAVYFIDATIAGGESTSLWDTRDTPTRAIRMQPAKFAAGRLWCLAG
jgi:hypothetical protein